MWYSAWGTLHVAQCMGHTVAQVVEELRNKPEGRRFDARWDHFIDFILPTAL
jgi:hypothetical protein